MTTGKYAYILAFSPNRVLIDFSPNRARAATMNFFKAKSKSPQELVRQTRDAIVSMEKDPANKKVAEKVRDRESCSSYCWSEGHV